MYVRHVNNTVVLFRKIFALDTRDQGCSEADNKVIKKDGVARITQHHNPRYSIQVICSIDGFHRITGMLWVANHLSANCSKSNRLSCLVSTREGCLALSK